MKAEHPMGDYIAPRGSEADVDRRWLAIAIRRRRRSRLRVVGYAVSAGAAALAMGVATWSSLRRPATLVPETGLVVGTRNESQTLKLADGSIVSLDRDTEITLARPTPGQQSLDIERGTVHIEVNHAKSRHFWVRAGDVDVTDVGTVFTVTRDRASSLVQVSVTEGEVDVISAGGAPRVLRAGESLTTLDRLSTPPPAAAVQAPSVVAPNSTLLVDAATPEAPPAEPDTLAMGEPPKPPARTMAPQGVPAEPSAVKAIEAPSAKSLFAEATAAREAGNAHAAAQALDALRRRFPLDAHTPLATFELGRIRMDRLGDRAGALEALRSAIAIARGAAFSEDAEARVVELLDKMGRTSECGRMRAAFLARRPGSIHEAAVTGACPVDDGAASSPKPRPGPDRAGDPLR